MTRNKIKYLLLISVFLIGCSIFYPPPPQQEPSPKEPSREYYHLKAEVWRCEELKITAQKFKPLCAQANNEKHYTCLFLKSYYFRCKNEKRNIQKSKSK
jgi:hypothetical protein